MEPNLVAQYRSRLIELQARMNEIAIERPARLDRIPTFTALEEEACRLQREIGRLEEREYAVRIEWPIKWTGSPQPSMIFHPFQARLRYSASLNRQDAVAELRFERVKFCSCLQISGEDQGSHRLAGNGLESDKAHQVMLSALLQSLGSDGANLMHYVYAFPDYIVEIAGSYAGSELKTAMDESRIGQ